MRLKVFLFMTNEIINNHIILDHINFFNTTTAQSLLTSNKRARVDGAAQSQRAEQSSLRIPPQPSRDRNWRLTRLFDAGDKLSYVRQEGGGAEVREKGHSI